MTEKSKPSVRKPREPKYFKMEERNSSGMDYYWHVAKKKKGFYLTGSEVGQVGDACETIREALFDDAQQYAGGTVKIDTNISLDELFEIMNMRNFEPFLNNTESLTLNGVEIDIESFRNFVVWYAEVCQKK